MEWACVLCAVEEEVPTWHQQLCLGDLGSWAMNPGEVAIATPDGEVYFEDYSGSSADIAAVRFSEVRWPPPPPGDPRGRAYPFRAEPSGAQRARYLAQAEAEVAHMFAARCGGRPLPAGGALCPMSEGVPGADPPRPVGGVEVVLPTSSGAGPARPGVGGEAAGGGIAAVGGAGPAAGGWPPPGGGVPPMPGLAAGSGGPATEPGVWLGWARSLRASVCRATRLWGRRGCSPKMSRC